MTPTAAPFAVNASARPVPGTWKLARGRAVTLRPRTDGVLRVAQGQVWATFDGPHGRTPDDAGDHVLRVGRSMFVRAGQRVVLEAWCGSAGASFAWDPVFATAPVARARQRVALAGVVQPLADLRHALVLAGRASVQLVAGLARLAWEVVRGAPARRPQGLAG